MTFFARSCEKNHNVLAASNTFTLEYANRCHVTCPPIQPRTKIKRHIQGARTVGSRHESYSDSHIPPLQSARGIGLRATYFYGAHQEIKILSGG